MAAEGRKTGHGTKSDAARERAVLALLTSRTIEAAANRAGVGERTLRRWLTEDAAFRADVETARRAIFEAGINRVQALTAKAVEALEDLMAAKLHPAVRLGAARTVLELAVHRHDTEMLLNRIEELERLQRESGPS